MNLKEEIIDELKAHDKTIEDIDYICKFDYYEGEYVELDKELFLEMADTLNYREMNEEPKIDESLIIMLKGGTEFLIRQLLNDYYGCFKYMKIPSTKPKNKEENLTIIHSSTGKEIGMIVNLKEEIICDLEHIGKNINDIDFISVYDKEQYVSLDIEEFFKIADKTNYNNMYGPAEINLDILIMFKGGTHWLERREYDGSEWFQERKVYKPSIKATNLESLGCFFNEVNKNLKYKEIIE